jgi:hypothetical protein
MTKKLEETFNLPPMDDEEEIKVETALVEPVAENIDELTKTLANVDKIDQALTPVKNLEALDSDMDKYAGEAMDAFQTLMDLGQNVEDRHAAPVFDSAAKMMANAITAKQAKMDKKLKVIQMQMQKQKLDLEEKKLEWQMAKAKGTEEDPNTIESTGEVILDRNDLMKSILEQVNGKTD